jgi:signal transduction histidine kinase
MDFTPVEATTRRQLGRPKLERSEHQTECCGLNPADFCELVQLSGLGLFSTDSAGQYRHVNETWSRLTGIPGGQASVEAWIATVHPDDRGRVEDEWSTAVALGSVFHSEYRMAKRNGVQRFRVSALPSRSATGEVEGFLGTLRELGDARAAARPCQSSRTFEATADSERAHDPRKLESVGTLAAGVAHDFNNLLAVVLGGTSLVRESLPETHAAQAFLKMVHDAARRGADLTSQLLAYSGLAKFVVEEVDLGELVRETAARLRPSVPPAIDLAVFVPPAVPAFRADPVLMRQMILNLAENALEALGHHEGTVLLELRVVRLPEDLADSGGPGAKRIPRGEYLLLTVSDTGCGMDEMTRSRAFEPFFTTKFMGRGLGLSAVEGIVQGHKGAIRVQSEPGRGSLFHIYLPISDGALRDN